ncbi:Agenet-like domain [Dillenia turbinata]|uniref:Agenet-like domain n=1 Tax=Dillenia turbinata TaxID=194707 RepID=A0AAN8ZS16_9MAGN
MSVRLRIGDTPMDYDENDYQGQNLHLAGEGNSKFPPVLRSYDLPKFDFDDSLQSHLRFDSLVETEVFLGIESQADNQWIADFSRGSTVIEFSSGAAESCSISSRNNVWSEATSSESVEMLLKSVGQEDMIPQQTIIEESDACDELDNSRKQVETTMDRDEINPPKMGDASDIVPTVQPDKLLEGGSGSNENMTNFVAETVDDLPVYGNELPSDDVSQKCGLPVSEGDELNVMFQNEINSSVQQSISNSSQLDGSTSMTDIDNKDVSIENSSTNVKELNNHELLHASDNSVDENVNGLPECSASLGADQINDESTDTVKDGKLILENPRCLASEVGSAGGKVLECSANILEEPSSEPVSETLAKSCEGVCCTNSDQVSNFDGVALSTDIQKSNRVEGNLPEVSEGATTFERNILEMSHSTSELHAGEALKVNSVEEKEATLQVTNCEASLLLQDNNVLLNSQSSSGTIHDDNHELNLSKDTEKGDLSKVGLPEGISVPNTNTGFGFGLAQEQKKDFVAEVIHERKEDSLGCDCSPADNKLFTGSLEETNKSDVSEGAHVAVGDSAEDKIAMVHYFSEAVESSSDTATDEGKAKLPTDTDFQFVGPLCENEVAFSSAVEGTEDASVQGSEPLLDSNPADQPGTLPSGNNVAGYEVLDVKGDSVIPSHEADFAALEGVSKAENVAQHKISLSGCEPLAVDSIVQLPSAFKYNPDVTKCEPETAEVGSGPSQSAVPPVDVSKADIDKFTTGETLKSAESHHVEGKTIMQSGLLALEESFHNSSDKVQEDQSASHTAGDGKSGKVEVPGNEGLSSPVLYSGSIMKSQGVEDGSCNGADSDKPCLSSNTIISASVSQNQNEGEVKLFQNQNGIVSEGPNKDCSIIQPNCQEHRETDTSQTDRSSTAEPGSSANRSGTVSAKGRKPSTIGQSSKNPMKGSSKAGLSADDKKVQEISQGSPQVPEGQIVQGTPKVTSEHKARRPSSKASGRESGKKGSLVKERNSTGQSDKGATGNAALGTSLNFQLVQSEGMQPYRYMDRSNIKPSGVSMPSCNLPDLNSSAPASAVFQQPFTDLQQVQLRAQIFVYGSLIQGTPPEEACMVSAFGASDGGRRVWENAWRTSVERFYSQKSHSGVGDTPLQSHSGASVPDQLNKQEAAHNKVVSSSAGRTSSKNTHSPVMSPIIPISSPLWSISTPPGDGLQPRATLLDFHQSFSPLHPYQTPPLRNFGQTPAWVSQPSFAAQWTPAPQTSAVDAAVCVSTLPITETVHLTPVKDSTLPQSSAMKNVTASPFVNSGGSTSVRAGPLGPPVSDIKNAIVTPGIRTSDPKPRKRKKVTVSEDLGQVSVVGQPQSGLLPVQPVKEPVLSVGAASHPSSSVTIITSSSPISRPTSGKFSSVATTINSTQEQKSVNMDPKKREVLSEETYNKIKEAKLHAEDAASLAAAAIGHSEGVWNQLSTQRSSGLISDIEAKISSAAVAIAAAASVAKAAAAAAMIASNAALQAKLMAEEALASSEFCNSIHSIGTTVSYGAKILRNATPASILKGEDASNCSSSAIVAAREAARKRLEAASAAAKRAENLDAVVRAAELAAAAVSQAGRIVAMGDPLPLSELVETGPEGYWKVPQVSLELAVNSKKINSKESDMGNVEENPASSAKHPKEAPQNNEVLTSKFGKPPILTEKNKDTVKDHSNATDGIPGAATLGEKDLRVQKGRKASNLAKSPVVVPESDAGSQSTSLELQNTGGAVATWKEKSIEEGSLVEVFKDQDGSEMGWFLANVLSLKDGQAYVCYSELPSIEGGQLKEWVALYGQADQPPKIRFARPLTAMRTEGTRKRSRAAMGVYTWSVGDKVDAWIQDRWWEGIVTEKTKKDETTLTIHFPAHGETLPVKVWNLRPSLIWKNGEWMEWSSSRENSSYSHEGDTPREKRLKLGNTAEEAKEKDESSIIIEYVESGKPEEQRLLSLSENENVFNLGKSTRDEKKPNTLRDLKANLQRGGSGVIFGVPKPGKKRKFMEVSKHYVADKSTNTHEANDSSKFSKYVIPPGVGSRGWRNMPAEGKEKQAAEAKPKLELKPKVPRFRKPPSVSNRTLPQKNNLSTSVGSATQDVSVTDHLENPMESVSHEENASGKDVMEVGSITSSKGTMEGPIVFSSLPLPPKAPSSKKTLTSNAKYERTNKGKLALTAAKLAKPEEEKIDERKTNPELLEGLQSSLLISKIPSVSHDRTHKGQSRAAASKGLLGDDV